MLNTVLSIMALLVLALLAGAFVLWRKGQNPKQALLMVVLAVVVIINIGIWTLPDAGGKSPVERAGEIEAVAD
ncbi:MAG: hypothetical protein R3E18_09655 [Sphingomonadaceae bacterium]|nr:hypothetical protein [Sphingomonadaceae bacterium]